MRQQRGSRRQFPAGARRGARLSFGLAAVLAVACAQVLGDIDVQKEPLQPATPTDGAAGATGGGVVGSGCELGEVRCSEEGQLQMCVRFEPGAPGGWLDQFDCGSPSLCVSGPRPVCRQAACQEGEVSCSGATPRVCNADLTGWTDQPACESAAHCSTEPAECPDGAPCCLVEPCEAGELRCNEGRLEECQEGLAGWTARSTCGTQELCQAGLAACSANPAACACQEPECNDGDTRCSDAGLEICNRGRTGWDPLGACGTPELCELGRALSPPRCQPPACASGDFVCEGSVLRACREDLTDYEDSDTCIGAGFCNAGAGQCDPAPCEPGERSCNGAEVQVCADDQTGFVPSGEECATAELCNDIDPTAVGCDSPRCAVDEYNCFGGSQLQVCNAGRTDFELAGPPCLRPDLCSAERRRCDFCVPGRQECTPDLLSSRVCALSGNFFGLETFCPLGCNGPTGLCRTCNIGEYICTNGTLQRCNDGRSFSPLNSASDCNNGLQVSCINGVVLQSACPQGLVCSGAGQCICTPGPAFCSGDDLLVCDGGELFFADPCQGEDGDILTTCDDGDLIEDRCDSPRECRQSDGSTCDD